MKENEAAAPLDHQDMSERIERATLESMAEAVGIPLGMEQAPPEQKYPYSEVDAQGYASMVSPLLVVWSSRWKVVDKLNQEEIDMLSTAAGRFVAWRFPSNGEEKHPGLALAFAAAAVAGPRLFQLWMLKQDEKERAAEEEKKSEEGGDVKTH